MDAIAHQLGPILGIIKHLVEDASQILAVFIAKECAGNLVGIGIAHRTEGFKIGSNDSCAGGHGLYQHDAEAFATGIWGHVDIGTAQDFCLFGVADPAYKIHALDLAGAATAHDGHADIVVYLAERAQQDIKALARFIQPTQEDNFQGIAGGFGRAAAPSLGVDRRIHAVGNENRVSAQLLHLPPPRHVGYRDATPDLFQEGNEERFGQGQHQGARRGSVIRRHQWALGHSQRGHGKARGVRLMDVQDIEVALLDELLYLACYMGPHGQARHRPVVRDGESRPSLDYEIRQLGGFRSGANDLYMVPLLNEDSR